MTLQEKLQHIFNSDYPGTHAFITEVIIPVFGDDIDFVNIDQAEKEKYREKASKAGLKKSFMPRTYTMKNIEPTILPSLTSPLTIMSMWREYV